MLRNSYRFLRVLDKSFKNYAYYTPKYSFSNKEEKEEEAKDRESEYIKRKRALEEKELEELKKKLNKTDAKFSLLNDLFKLSLGKIFAVALVLGSGYFGFQFYSMLETFNDPIENKKKILFLKYSDEVRLARATLDLIRQQYTLISNNNSVYEKFKGYYDAVKDNQEIKQLNLQINGNVYLLDCNELIFNVLNDGSLFISTAMAQNIESQKDFNALLAIELCHNYLRTNAKNMDLSSVYTVWKFKQKGFSVAKVLSPEDFNILRKIQFLPIKSTQEDDMFELLPSFLNILDQKMQYPKDVETIVDKIKIHDFWIHQKKDSDNRKIENYFKRHNSLLRKNVA